MSGIFFDKENYKDSKIINRYLVVQSITIWLLFISGLNAHAQTSSQELPQSPPFIGLKTFIVEYNKACDPQPVRKVTCDAKFSNEVSGTSDGKTNSQDILGWQPTRVIRTKIHRTSNDTYLIGYNPGPSCDPNFAILPEDGKSVIGVIDADHIVIPGNGYIYSLARSNAFFTVHQKFTIQGRKLVEIRQPFFYVGLDTTIKRDLMIYATMEGHKTVANVPKGEKITVLLNKGVHYLVKTQFGLVGWIKIGTGSQYSDIIDGIFFMGD